jgi:hypothetical protein
MNKTKQKRTEEAPVVSPLANEKTYGERVYSRVFDWGLNYWTNLLASAVFSQWVEHGERPFKLPLMKKVIAPPREIQQNFAEKLASLIPKIPFMKDIAADVAAKRSMAVARSLTLLMPGFFVMIPSVWLGAKIKPWIVETLNKHHYGEEAMDDPSLKARHQAIEAEARPTFAGTFIARCATAVAVNIAALSIGSDKNWINKFGEKRGNAFLSKAAVDPTTKQFGYALGGAAPQGAKTWTNKLANRHGLNWSAEQFEKGEVKIVDGVVQKYDTALQDFGRFVVADTVYTLITALLIRPFIKIIRHIPGMSYKPKVAANSPVLDGDKVKVPANRYADVAPDSNALETTAALDSAHTETSANASKSNADMPSAKVSNVRDRATLSAMPEQQLA